jgi:hypothetical protein
MVERMTTNSVQFAFPFLIGGMDGPQAPGTYEVQTIEEQIDGLSFVAYRRLSTTITPSIGSKTNSVRQITEIDPMDLAAALDRDAAASIEMHRS